MTYGETIKFVASVFRLLKVNEIVIPIGRTNKGNLGIKFTANSNDFEIMLDAVPLPTKDSLNDENNIDLKKMIEKYWFGDITTPPLGQRGWMVMGNGTTTGPGQLSPVKQEPKKRGRPRKVK